MPDAIMSPGLAEFVDSLETMAFVTPMPAPPDAVAPSMPRLIQIEYACPQYGAIRIAAGSAFGALLASNLLAIDPSTPEALAASDDVLQELANITCGAVIRQRGLATDERLHMSLPTSEPMDTAQWDAFVAMADVQVLDADGHIIAFQTVGLEAA